MGPPGFEFLTPSSLSREVKQIGWLTRDLRRFASTPSSLSREVKQIGWLSPVDAVMSPSSRSIRFTTRDKLEGFRELKLGTLAH
jgi:hypothetical protein